MISGLIFIVLGALIIASLIDLKYKAVPSVALTGILFLVAGMGIEYLHFGILAGLFTIGVVVYVTGLYNFVGDWFSEGTSGIWSNVVMVVLVVGAMIVAVVTGKKKKKIDD